MKKQIKVIETGKILTDLHYKRHHLQVQFHPGMNAFRVWLVWDDTNMPHDNRVEDFCPYNMSKTAAEYFIRYLYWYQCCIADPFEDSEYNVEEKNDVAERKKGKWKDYPIADGCLKCSCCGVLRIGEPSNFCPWCGADMRESEQGFWWVRNMFTQTEEKTDG